MIRLSVPWALLAVAAGTAKAQFSNWVKDQISTEICTWEQPRAAIIRDVIYLDGGNIWWLPRMKDGTTGAAANDGNTQGLILNYNLSTSFDKNTNVTAILLKDAMSKSRGGKGNSNGAAPNYVDGGMLANDAEFFLYGGVLIRNTKLYQDPADDEVLAYQAYQYGVDKPSWNPGFIDGVLPTNVTRYVAYGATVNVPSENKAWYFSGLQSESHGTIFTNGANDTTLATNVTNNFIELDMSEQLSETWTNRTLPDSIQGRSNAEVVWVPVGKEGILVVLGGATYPYWADEFSDSPNETLSKEQSPTFMSTIDIYDIANKKWYKQPTEDGPKARARGCAVVAPASDRSSFNIFYYGGMDGIHVTEAYSDEVWVLSLPSFTWTKINEGDSLHARAGHKCFAPYPDQMMILGGYTPLAGDAITCLKDGPVVMFNLSSGAWVDSYDPAKHADYGVNSKIQSKIGGNSAGGATATTPVPSGWATSALAQVFETSYTNKISTYYPYATEASSTGSSGNNTNGSNDDNNGGGGSSLPKWVAPVLGVVLGLVFVTGALVVFCLWRRRKAIRTQSSNYGSEDTGMRIISWMRGHQTEKAPTVTTSDDTPLSPDMEIARAVGTTPSNNPSPGPPAEMADTQVAELADTSYPAELHDTGLSPVEIIQKHSHFAETKTRSGTDPSYSSFTTGQDQASSVSRPSGVPSSGVVNPIGEDTSARVTSDVSGVSDTDAANLRRLSAVAPVSPRSDAGDIPARERSADVSPGPASPTPVSPPTAGEDTSQDYLSAKPTISPLRRSIFKEHDEDMDKQQ